jgi:hypothetical protein
MPARRAGARAPHGATRRRFSQSRGRCVGGHPRRPRGG